jgi:predicted DsbA family dithiol-disulfide isomerase
MSNTPALHIQVDFDLICPWCLIGKRHLETALAMFAELRPDVATTVEWRSCPLIPQLPAAGIPYREFYLARLGGPEPLAIRQAQVRNAASEAGLTLALDRIEVMPNTLLAHRLLRYARESGAGELVPALIEWLFQAYFMGGENLGSPALLRRAADACGLTLPPPEAGPDPDLAWLPDLYSLGEPMPRPAHGVPNYVINGTQAISGARPPRALLEAMLHVLARPPRTGARALA